MVHGKILKKCYPDCITTGTYYLSSKTVVIYIVAENKVVPLLIQLIININYSKRLLLNYNIFQFLLPGGGGSGGKSKISNETPSHGVTMHHHINGHVISHFKGLGEKKQSHKKNYFQTTLAKMVAINVMTEKRGTPLSLLIPYYINYKTYVFPYFCISVFIV